LLRLLKDLRTTSDQRTSGHVSHKIEFSYLNPNLVVPKTDPITLTLRAKDGSGLLFARRNDGFDKPATIAMHQAAED